MKNNDDNIKKMATLLRNGATMLDLSCPVCNNLIFKLKNKKIFCPTCEKEVIIQKEKSDKNISNDFQAKNQENNQSSNFDKELIEIKNFISNLCSQLNKSNLFQDSSKILDSILKSINIYKEFKNL